MIPLIVLAAGLSSRMGRPKALLPIAPDGSTRETFLGRILRSAREATVEEIVVVLGHEADAIRAAVGGEDGAVRVVVNPEYRRGQLSSLLAGLDAIDRPDVPAFMFTLVDVPFVQPSTIQAVVARYRACGAPVVRPVLGELHGHPVLIDRSLFAALRASPPSRGAKPVVRAHVSAAGDVPVDDRGAFVDIDTVDEYERVTRDRWSAEDATGR